LQFFFSARGFADSGTSQAEPDERFLVGRDFMRGLRGYGLWFTYDISLYPRQLAAAIELVSQFPEQRFVVDHMAKPDIKAGSREPWATGMRTIAQNSNVYCKLSGLVTEADWHHWKPEDMIPYLDVVFEAFGPKRLMFGSDWPVCLLAAGYRHVKQLVESYVEVNAAEHKHDIFGRNAERFYGRKADIHGLAA
jgi:L-fuconolactonase